MEEKILQTMAQSGAMKAGQVAEAIGESKEDVAKAIKKLVKEGKVFSPKVCFYDIKK